MDIFSSFLFFSFLRYFVFLSVNAIGVKDNCVRPPPPCFLCLRSVSALARRCLHRIISDIDRNGFSLAALTSCLLLAVGHPSRYFLVREQVSMLA